MPFRTRAFSGTPESAAEMQPWVMVAHPLTHGVPLGIDLRTKKLLVFDPWQLKIQGIVNSLTTMVIGQKGEGKSALSKVLNMRLGGALSAENGGDIRIRVNDKKPEDGNPEYANLTEFFDSTVISLRNQQINIFDTSLLQEESELLDTVINVCEFAAGRPLTGYEPFAVQVGVYCMLRDFPATISPMVLEGVLRRLDKNDVDDYYRNSDSQLVQSISGYFDTRVLRQLDATEVQRRRDMEARLRAALERPHNLNVTQFMHDASMVSTFLNRILRGDLGRMFGGQASLRPLLEQRSVTLDWTGLHPRGASLMRAILWKVQTSALVRNDMGLIPHLDTDDEDHGSWNDLIYARFKAEYVKTARAYPTMNMALTHRLADYATVGEAGSEQRSRALNMLNDVDMWFVAKQHDDKGTMEDVRRQLRFSRPDIHAVSRLGIGQFAMKLGSMKPIFFQLVLTPEEWSVIETDRATRRMLRRIPVMENPEVLRRLAHGGIKMIGE